MTRHPALLALALLAAGAFAVAMYRHQRPPERDTLMARHLQERVTSASPARVDCNRFRAQAPLVLLAIGQSNAGNHGPASPPALRQASSNTPVQVMDAGLCSLSQDPLPGATGTGTSIWSLLPAQLTAAGLRRPVVLQVLAVDASSIDDWTRESAPIAQQLSRALSANRAAGLQPDLVLWQQGEADARAGTAPDSYALGLQALAARLQAGGVQAPVLLARSTVCRSAPAAGLQAVQAALVARDSRFRAGPDTDAINQRHDACHWSDSGRAQAADLWAAAIMRALPASALAPLR